MDSVKVSQKATLVGFSSIFIWASLVAVVKLITEALSPILAIALIYSFSALSILMFNGMPNIKKMPKAYLWGCGALFIAYEILFLTAIALSKNHEQVLIIAMINYLWPPLMIVFSIFAKQLNYQKSVILGFVLAVLGLMLVVNGQVWQFAHFLNVLKQNPLAYSFAFLGAILWPCYSVLTKKYAQGYNAVPLFFTATAMILWLIHFLIKEVFIFPSIQLWLLIALTGSLIGLAYSNWNQSLQYGNMKVLILATYFMPIFSSLMSIVILGAAAELSFWIGCLLVSLGAIICWKSTSERTA